MLPVLRQDRFAYGTRDAMLDGYATQWEKQLRAQPVRFAFSEALLCTHLKEQRITVDVTDMCIVRVRAGGQHVRDDYIQPRENSHCCPTRCALPPTRDHETSCPDPPPW